MRALHFFSSCYSACRNRRHFSGRKSLSVFSLLLIGSCQTGALWPFDRDFTEKVQIPLEEGMVQIAQYHVSEVNSEQLILDGLEYLSEADPDLRFRDSGSTLQLLVNGSEIERYEKPVHKTPSNMAGFAARLLKESRNLSPRLEKIGNEALLSGFLNKSLQGLDRFSRYYSPSEARTIVKDLEGYYGVGLSLSQTDGQIIVSGVTMGSPAEQADVPTGAILKEIDGLRAVGMTVQQAQALLEGAKGSSVTLTFKYPQDKASRKLQLDRRRILPQSVFFTDDPVFPTVSISIFNAQTAREFKALLDRKLSQAKDPLQGLVLDLRGNPGGLLEQAIEIADMFLDSGQIIKETGRHFRSRRQFTASPGDLLKGLPLIVLVDGATASSAEILAAALQDNRRAVIVGSISYGKGAVQVFLPLKNAGKLDLTWAYYQTAGQYAINGFGVLPTICTVGYDNGIAAVLVSLRKRAESTRRSFLTLRQMQYGQAGKVETFRNSCSWQADNTRDLEFEAAITLLNDQKLYQDALELAYLLPGGS